MARRIYVPLDVSFMDDERVEAVGERSGWLLIAIYCDIKARGVDGFITDRQMGKLNIPGWRKRLQPLLDVDLVRRAGPDMYEVPNWLKWNESQSERDARSEAARARVMRRWNREVNGSQEGPADVYAT